MKEGYKFIRTLEGIEKPIEWSDLNQLKKDILWVFDMNVGELNASFIPDGEFQEKYWEYLTLDGDKWFYDEDRDFYKEGVIIILLCMTVEYIDTTGGNQGVFGSTKVSEVIKYVDCYSPSTEKQTRLKEILQQGLKIAESMTPADLVNTDGYDHPEMGNFYPKLSWVSDAFIKEYYRQKIK